jgi:hypothetical protein
MLISSHRCSPRVYCKKAILSCPIKGHPIRVAQPIGVNLIEPFPTHERVVLRNPVGVSSIHINAQNGPQEVLDNILAIPTLIKTEFQGPAAVC